MTRTRAARTHPARCCFSCSAWAIPGEASYSGSSGKTAPAVFDSEETDSRSGSGSQAGSPCPPFPLAPVTLAVRPGPPPRNFPPPPPHLPRPPPTRTKTDLSCSEYPSAASCSEI